VRIANGRFRAAGGARLGVRSASSSATSVHRGSAEQARAAKRCPVVVPSSECMNARGSGGTRPVFRGGPARDESSTLVPRKVRCTTIGV
jgi:hypothetical protein